jgi:hypothetical protein
LFDIEDSNRLMTLHHNQYELYYYLDAYQVFVVKDLK